MPVMSSPDRLELIRTLRQWTADAEAGIQCATDVPPGIIGLIKRASDEPDAPGGP